MRTSTPTYAPASSLGWRRAADYLELAKPKIMLIELITVVVAAIVAKSDAPDL